MSEDCKHIEWFINDEPSLHYSILKIEVRCSRCGSYGYNSFQWLDKNIRWEPNAK